MVSAGADFSQPAVADEKENEDSEDQVMNVPSAGLNEMKGRNLVLDGIDRGPDSGEGEKETDRSYKQPPPRPVGNAFVKNITKRRSLQQQQQEGRARDGEQEYEP